jgi:hypothetical protein
MNSEFEKRMQSQSFREIPGQWRGEIMAEAAKWQSRPGSAPARHPTLRLLSDWLWPHPKAWAGLAAIWIVILAMNLADSDGRRQMANVNPPPSRAMLEALKEQQQMLARIFAPPAPVEAEPPKPSRPSRSEIRPLRRYV